MSNRSPERPGVPQGVNNGKIDRAPIGGMLERKEVAPCLIKVKSHSKDADPSYHTADDRSIELENGGVILDGMSGEGGGYIAAELAKGFMEPRLRSIPRAIDPNEAKKRIVEIIGGAEGVVAGQKVIFGPDGVAIPQTQEEESLPGPSYIGTTATLGAVFHHQGKEFLVVAWVGDSPGYLIRGGVAQDIAPTIDRKNGRSHGSNSKLDNFIGMSRRGREMWVSTDIRELRHGDKVVLASDGAVSEYNLSPEQVAKIVEDNPEGAANQLVDQGWSMRKAGKRDDATAIVIIPELPESTRHASEVDLPVWDDGRDWGELGAEHGRRERRRRGAAVRRRIGGGMGRRKFLEGLMGVGLGIAGSLAAAETGFLSGIGIPRGVVSQIISGSGETPQAQQPQEAAQGQPRHETPKDFPKPVPPDNRESSRPLPDPGRKPAVPAAEPKPPAVPSPETAPAPPPVVDRNENVEGKIEAPAAFGNDALKTIRKIFKKPYQGDFVEGRDDNSLILLLMSKGFRRTIGDGSAAVQDYQSKDLRAAPEYSALGLEETMPALKTSLFPSTVVIDYPGNKDLNPARIRVNGSLPLRSIPQVAGLIREGKIGNRKVDEIPLGDIPTAFEEVVNLDFIRGGKAGLTMKEEGNRWRAEGVQASNGGKVEIVCAPDGRFSVRITNDSYKQRPGEDAHLRVPQVTFW